MAAERRRELVSWWLHKVLRIAGVTLRVEGTPPPAGVGAMIAANHVSWLDICAVAAARSTRFVAKSEIRDWPLAGWISERAGTIFIRRDKRRETTHTNERVGEMLAAGDCIGLFPEGTTTEGDALLRFHSSLFQPAVTRGTPVYPCAIRYERSDGSLCREASFVGEVSFPQSLGLVLRQRDIAVRVSFAAPIDSHDRSRREVAQATRAAIARLLGLEADTEPRTPGDPPGAPR